MLSLLTRSRLLLSAATLANVFFSGAAGAVNFVTNPGFEMAGASSPTSFTGILFGGASAAASWTVWNNSSATTETTLVSPSSDTIAPGGANMLEVYTTGAGNGVVQIFAPDIAHHFSVDILDQVGQVQLVAAYSGNNWVTTVIDPSPDWQHVVVETPINKNEITIYSYSATGAVFFVDNASASSAVPEASTWTMMLLGFAGLGFAGYRQQRKAVAA